MTVSLLTVQHSFAGFCLTYTTIVLQCLCHCKQYNIPWCTTFLQGTLCYIHLCCLTVIVSVYSAMFLLTTLWTGIALLHSVSVCTLQTMHCSLRRKTYKKSTLLHNLMCVSGLYKFLRVTYLIRKSNSPQPDVCLDSIRSSGRKTHKKSTLLHDLMCVSVLYKHKFLRAKNS